MLGARTATALLRASTLLTTIATPTTVVAPLLVAVGAVTTVISSSATDAAASWSWSTAPIAFGSERKIHVVATGTGPIVVVEGSTTSLTAVGRTSTATSVTSVVSITSLLAATSVVSITALLLALSTSVVAVATSALTLLVTLAVAVSRCTAPVTFGSEGEVHVAATGAGPVVGALLLGTSAVISEASLFPAALTPVVSSVVSEASLFPPALTSVVSTVSRTAFSARFLPLFFGSNGHRDTNQGVHVERTVNVRNMGQGMIGAADNAVHLSDVRAVVSSDHDGVKSGG